MMKKYETILILNSSLSEEKVAAEVEKVKKILEPRCSNLHVEHWGKREIVHSPSRAYKGIYVVLYFDTEESSLVADLTHQLRIMELIEKFQTHRIEERVRKTRQTKSGDSQENSMSAE